MKNRPKEKKARLQVEEFAELLKNIAVNVGAEDRKECVKKLSISESTLSGYLNGDVKDPGTAYKIYIFLKKRVELRNQVLA